MYNYISQLISYHFWFRRMRSTTRSTTTRTVLPLCRPVVLQVVGKRCGCWMVGQLVLHVLLRGLGSLVVHRWRWWWWRRIRIVSAVHRLGGCCCVHGLLVLLHGVGHHRGHGRRRVSMEHGVVGDGPLVRCQPPAGSRCPPAQLAGRSSDEHVLR